MSLLASVPADVHNVQRVERREGFVRLLSKLGACSADNAIERTHTCYVIHARAHLSSDIITATDIRVCVEFARVLLAITRLSLPAVADAAVLLSDSLQLRIP